MTFYIFSHFIQAWILPPGFNLLLMWIGFLCLHYAKWLGRSVIAIAFVTLWLFSTPIIAQLLIDQLQYQYPILNINKISKHSASAIIVLGGGDEISLESKNGYQLSDASEFRLRYAATLYQQTHFPIIVSGGNITKPRPSEANLMREEMQNYFHTPVAWEENKSINTRDEGNLLVAILKKHGVKKAYLVTNAFHMPRAMYTFKKSFSGSHINIIAAPMGYSVLQPDAGMLNYLPSIDAINISETALHEFIGIIAYHLNNAF